MSTISSEEKTILTVREVGTILRVDDTTVRRWIKNNVLLAVTLPHAGKRCAYRIKKKTVIALLNDGNEDAQDPSLDAFSSSDTEELV